LNSRISEIRDANNDESTSQIKIAELEAQTDALNKKMREMEIQKKSSEFTANSALKTAEMDLK